MSEGFKISNICKKICWVIKSINQCSFDEGFLNSSKMNHSKALDIIVKNEKSLYSNRFTLKTVI